MILEKAEIGDAQEILTLQKSRASANPKFTMTRQLNRSRSPWTKPVQKLHIH
jgi:hypothetical protein